MQIVPDVLVVSPVAYVHLILPEGVPLGLLLSQGLERVLRGQREEPELYQIAAEKDGEVLILGFEADAYRDLLVNMEVDGSHSTVVPYDELTADDDVAFLLTDGPLDGAAHLYALCSAYARRDVEIGGEVAGRVVLARAGQQVGLPERPSGAMLA